MRYLLAVLAVVAGLFLSPTPAEASGPVVMVELHVRGSQEANVRAAVRFVDRYTGSHFVYGACRYDRRCVIVKTVVNRAKGTGYSSWKGSARKRVTVSVNPGRGDGYMRRLFAHEIGHAMFLSHSRYRSNLMWPTLFRSNGRMVTMRFTSHQRAVLRRH